MWGGAPTRTIAESFVDLSRRVRTLDDFDEISICPYGKNARSGYREFVAIYVRPTGKSTNDGVGKKLLHTAFIVLAIQFFSLELAFNGRNTLCNLKQPVLDHKFAIKS